MAEIWIPVLIKASDVAVSFAFKAAYELIFNGLNEPSGYTEPILHKMRIQKKINLGNYNQ